MIDPDGTEWLTIDDAARQVRVNPATLRQWKSRAKVRAHVIDGRVWLHMGDVIHAERQWRVRVSLDKPEPVSHTQH